MSKKELSLRAAQIVSELAEMKRAFFVDGIEKPMAVRVALEAELANVRLAALQIKDEENAKKMQIRQIRGEILRLRLIELGFPNLIDECNAEAELQWNLTQDSIEGIPA